MSSPQIPFIVGVIREKEKSLLQADEYTRLIDAIAQNDTQSPLTDTAYGLYLASENTTPAQALDARLYDEFTWLVEQLGPQNPTAMYLAARYDGLHIASALMDYKEGKPSAQTSTKLGLVTAELLTSTIWRNQGWEDTPAPWREFVKTQKEATSNDGWSRKSVLVAVGKQYLEVLRKTGKSKLAEQLTALLEKRTETESEIRPNDLPSDLIAYEKGWDEDVLAAIRPYRFEPNSIDAVLAWWYALTIEVKTIRLLLLSAGGKTDKQTLQNIERSLYLNWI